MKIVWRLVEAVKRWSADDGNIMAASVAYYTSVTFFPLLLVLISGLGLFLQFSPIGQDAEKQVVSAIGDYASPDVAEDIATMLAGVRDHAPVGGPLGLAVLVFAAGTIFAQFERAFNRIWNLDDPNAQSIWGTIRNVVVFRLRAFLLLICVGILIFVVFVAGMVLSWVQALGEEVFPIPDSVWRIVQAIVSVALNTLVFTLLYRYLPRVEVRWREAASGAVVTAVAWEIGRMVLAAFVIGGRYSAYGVIGSFLAVMLWIYYAACIIFVGAEYVQVMCKERNPTADPVAGEAASATTRDE